MRIDKDNIKIILILLVVALGIGYSYLNTELNINGTANINSANWNVYWNNVQVSNGSVSADTPTIDANKTTVTFNVTLTKPGDYYEFTVDAVNAGTIDAMIETMNSKLNWVTIEELPAYLDYGITYADDTPLQANQELLHDSTETYKVSLAYKDNISASDLPGTNQSLSFEFAVDYKQADEAATEVDHGTAVYTVSEISSYIGQAMPSDITQYSSAADAMAAKENKPIYSKQILRNGIIDESYIEFVVKQYMADDNSGMTVGTYSLKGNTIDMYDLNDDEYAYYCKDEYHDESIGECISPYYERNKRVLKSAYGVSNCSEIKNSNETIYRCEYLGLISESSTNGIIRVRDSNWYCQIWAVSTICEDYE